MQPQKLNTKFWGGFEKQAKIGVDRLIKHYGTDIAEIAGLGMLAIPSLKKMKKKTEHKVEVAGLGTLALPSIRSIYKGIYRGR